MSICHREERVKLNVLFLQQVSVPTGNTLLSVFYFFDIGTEMHKWVRILRQIMQNHLKLIFAWVWFYTWAIFCSLVYLCCWQSRINYVGCSDREDDSPLRGSLSRLSGRLQRSVEHSSREKAVSKRTCLASTEASVWSPESTKQYWAWWKCTCDTSLGGHSFPRCIQEDRLAF